MSTYTSIFPCVHGHVSLSESSQDLGWSKVIAHFITLITPLRKTKKREKRKWMVGGQEEGMQAQQNRETDALMKPMTFSSSTTIESRLRINFFVLLCFLRVVYIYSL